MAPRQHGVDDQLKLVIQHTGSMIMPMTGLPASRMAAMGAPLARLFFDPQKTAAISSSRPAAVRLVVTLVFGLIHGFGFAADLLESRLPPGKVRRYRSASIWASSWDSCASCCC